MSPLQAENSIPTNPPGMSVKRGLVVLLCTLGLSFFAVGLRRKPDSGATIMEPEQHETLEVIEDQSLHLANEHQRLRRNLTRRKLLYRGQQKDHTQVRELKLLQKDFVNCSQYQYTLSITNELRINYVVDVDESRPGGGIFKAEMIYDGQAWLGFAHSEQGSMQGSIAIIGSPEALLPDHRVQKYLLGDPTGGSATAAVPLMPENQTLLDTSLMQTEDLTVMRFSKLLSEPNELTIHTEMQNTFLFAHGSSNTLGAHLTRGVMELNLMPCLPSRRGHDVKPGDRLDQDAEDRYEASSNYVITVGTGPSEGQDPPPIKPIEHKKLVPEEQPQAGDSTGETTKTDTNSEEPQQFDIPVQFTVDDDHLQNLPLSYTSPTKGMKIWWTLHGCFAMLSCGILLPTVIASSLLQGCCGTGKKRPRHHTNQVHRWANFFLLLAILATFVTAVIGAAKDTRRNDTPIEEAVTYVDTVAPRPEGPKPETYHSPAGLALFILCLFYALTGNLRSYLSCSPSPANAEDQDEDQEERRSDFNSDTIKSGDSGMANVARRWDQCHCLIGVVLLFVTWWQCQSGLEMFEYRFADSWFNRTFFWSITGSYAGLLGFACVLQLLYLILQWCYKAAYW